MALKAKNAYDLSIRDIDYTTRIKELSPMQVHALFENRFKNCIRIFALYRDIRDLLILLKEEKLNPKIRIPSLSIDEPIPVANCNFKISVKVTFSPDKQSIKTCLKMIYTNRTYLFRANCVSHDKMQMEYIKLLSAVEHAYANL